MSRQGALMVKPTSIHSVVAESAAWSSLSLDAIRMELEKLGEPAYRSRQLHAALHHRGLWDWAELGEWPVSLRSRAADIMPLRTLDVSLDLKSRRDGTNKVLFALAGSSHIEAVLMAASRGTVDTRYTVCVSSQIGCPAACSFCATGLGGFSRNLATAEIVDQVEFFAGRLIAQGKRLHNVVYMGMGEPFLNYKRVMQSIKELRNPIGLSLGSRRITVSTVGIVPGIRRFTQEGGEVNLAISLHAPTDELRSTLVPYNEHYPISELMHSAKDYVRDTRRRVTFEYVLLKGKNDGPTTALQLSRLVSPFGQMAHVNLIPWNPFREGAFVRSEAPDAQVFSDVLRRNGVNATIRFSKGLDIDAACGQLRDRAEDNLLAS
jgi:23S rRNA (adenine2503-C2)-methyltransferase